VKRNCKVKSVNIKDCQVIKGRVKNDSKIGQLTEKNQKNYMKFDLEVVFKDFQQ
jgi:hypothetical protein